MEEKELYEKIDSHPSCYPYIYKLLDSYKKDKIHCENENSARLVEELINTKTTPHQRSTYYLQYLYRGWDNMGFISRGAYILNPRYSDPKVDEFLLETLKMFYPFNNMTKDYVEKIREPYREDRIDLDKIKDLKGEEKVFNLTWSFDGWYNTSKNMEIEGLEEKVLDYLLELKKQPVPDPFFFSIKYKLMAAYRNYNLGNIKKSIKIMKSLNSFSLLKLSFKNVLRETPEMSNILRIKLLIAYFKIYKTRQEVNRDMFLYKVTRKEKYYKRHKRRNNFWKLTILNHKYAKLNMSDNVLKVRPQHLLKMAEMEIESKKPNEDYIKFLLFKASLFLNNKDDKSLLIYFSIMEYMFVVFLYFYKVKKIDVIKEIVGE